MNDVVDVGPCRLRLVRGDITLQDVDAIVNAANSSLGGGGGVDGAIHRAAGPALAEECRAIRTRQGGCPTGGAALTSGGHLKARHVIHAVGPVWHGGGSGEEDLLADAYHNSLVLALEHGVRTIAFPSISTGAYGFPPERASLIAFSTVCRFLQDHRRPEEVRFVAFSESDYHVYARLFHAYSDRERTSHRP